MHCSSHRHRGRGRGGKVHMHPAAATPDLDPDGRGLSGGQPRAGGSWPRKQLRSEGLPLNATALTSEPVCPVDSSKVSPASTCRPFIHAGKAPCDPQQGWLPPGPSAEISLVTTAPSWNPCPGEMRPNRKFPRKELHLDFSPDGSLVLQSLLP